MWLFADESILDFCSRRRSYYRILPRAPTIPPTAPALPYSCTCHQYRHYMVCKHALGFAIMNGLIPIPRGWNCNPFVGRKRGRPALVAPALEE